MEDESTIPSSPLLVTPGGSVASGAAFDAAGAQQQHDSDSDGSGLASSLSASALPRHERDDSSGDFPASPQSYAPPPPVQHERGLVAWVQHAWARSWHAIRYDPTTQQWVFAGACFWLLFTLVYLHGFAARTSYGTPEARSCLDNAWPGADACGLEGGNCQPFVTDEWKPFRCLNRCGWHDKFIAVGSGPYHPASHVCSAAIHAGAIPRNGGCGLMRMAGAQPGFNGSVANGVKSATNGAWFPASMEFRALLSAEYSNCTDLSWTILVLTLLMLLVATWMRPSKPVLWGWLLAVGYVYVAFIGQPQGNYFPELFMIGTQRAWILLAFGVILYRFGPQFTIFRTKPHSTDGRRRGGGDSRVEMKEMKYGRNLSDDAAAAVPRSSSFASNDDIRVVRDATELLPLQQVHPWWFNALFWVLPYFLALHLNFATYVIPDVTLDAKLFGSGAKAILTLFIGLIIVSGLVLYHVWLVWKHGLLRKFAVPYITAVLVYLIISMVAAPVYKAHLHHAAFTLVLLPLTPFPDRPLTTISQAILTGVFVNGLAAWGWESNWDGPFLPVVGERRPAAPLVPVLDANGTVPLTQITLAWHEMYFYPSVVGYQLWMNDMVVLSAHRERNTSLSPYEDRSLPLLRVTLDPARSTFVADATVYPHYRYTRTDLLPHLPYTFTLTRLHEHDDGGIPGPRLTVTTGAPWEPTDT